MMCVCRKCHREYDESRSRADYRGYCSQACLHAMAKKLGFKKKPSDREYRILLKNGEIGNVPA